MDPRRTLGRHGEDLAVDHLVAGGMQVLDRSWRCRHGEIDVVARDGRCLVVVEVKTRRTLATGDPAEAVTRVKLRRLRLLAQLWCDARGSGWQELRVDVVAVTLRRGSRPDVRHLVGVG